MFNHFLDDGFDGVQYYYWSCFIRQVKQGKCAVSGWGGRGGEWRWRGEGAGGESGGGRRWRVGNRGGGARGETGQSGCMIPCASLVSLEGTGQFLDIIFAILPQLRETEGLNDITARCRTTPGVTVTLGIAFQERASL